MIKDNIFQLWTPITDLSKAEDDEGSIKIGGICSSENEDQAGEIILQSGLDFSYFLKRGYFNLEHQPGPGNVLGNPTSIKPARAENGKPATYVEGILYTTKSKARDVIDTIKAMNKAKADRKIGFSIEGSVLARDKRNPKIITKAKVMNVSITSAPCNTDAQFEMIKKNILGLFDDELENNVILGDEVNMDIEKAKHDKKKKEDEEEMMEEEKEMDKADPKKVAAKLLADNPQLKDPKVMEAIHSMMEKSDMSAIQRESLEDQIASEDYDMDEKLLREILKLLMKAYPEYSDDELLDFMEEMAKAYYKKSKK